MLQVSCASNMNIVQYLEPTDICREYRLHEDTIPKAILDDDWVQFFSCIHLFSHFILPPPTLLPSFLTLTTSGYMMILFGNKLGKLPPFLLLRFVEMAQE